MATLSGQSINSTYQGLLKLADSTTGITSSFQQIQDGLGSDTGITIKQNYLNVPNVLNYYPQTLDYGGVGFATNTIPFVANSQNRIGSTPFYDKGLFSYSAITYYCSTISTTSDVLDVAFYTPQWVSATGLGPLELIMSGISLTTNSIGLKTTVLPSTLSFSGYGGGYYILAYKLSNSGVNPTVQYFALATTQATQIPYDIGMIQQNPGTISANISYPSLYGTFGCMIYTSASTFKQTYTSADLATGLSTFTGSIFGFALNIIK